MYVPQFVKRLHLFPYRNAVNLHRMKRESPTYGLRHKLKFGLSIAARTAGVGLFVDGMRRALLDQDYIGLGEAAFGVFEIVHDYHATHNQIRDHTEIVENHVRIEGLADDEAGLAIAVCNNIDAIEEEQSVMAKLDSREMNLERRLARVEQFLFDQEEF